MRALCTALLMMLLCAPLRAGSGQPGDFDYYVLALSWSPTWCALEGEARGAAQCDAGRKLGWGLHGLWPQYTRGYPEFCKTPARPPSRRMTAAMTDIMGSGGLAWHQWRKHGSCTGLSAAQYFEVSRRAYAQIKRPIVFRQLDKAVKLPASVVEEAFLKANPELVPDGITITCRQGRIQEARICLSRDLAPVPCGQDVVRDCTMNDALFDPLR